MSPGPDPSEILKTFLREVGEDPFALQALADAIEEGVFPRTGDGVTFTAEGLEWMEAREAELRRLAN